MNPSILRSPAPIRVAAGVLLASLAWGVGGLSPAVLAAPPAAPQELLSNERWQEDQYGLSLLPPLGSRLEQGTADETLVRIAGELPYSIEVYVRQVKTDQEVGEFFQSDPNNPSASAQKITYDNRGSVVLDMDAIVTMGAKQVAIAHPGAVLMDQKRLDISGHPSAILYFQLAGAEGAKQWVLGHAYMLIDHQTFAMLRLVAAKDQFDSIRQVFEAVVNSLNVEAPQVRDQLRSQQVQVGQDWQATIDRQRYAQILVPEQWLRIIQDNDDLGYVRITQKKATQMGVPGIAVQVQARVYQGPDILDSLADQFLSNDGEQEVWSVKATRRPRSPQPSSSGITPPQETSVAETGVRSGHQITLTRQDGASAKQYVWETPPQGYLSQVELQLLPQLLPRRQTEVMGFYAYFAATGAITYRTVQVEAGPSGAYSVRVQPGPNQPTELSLYDKTGRLIERTFPGSPGAEGRKMVPSTRQQIASIWKMIPDR